MFVCVAGIFYLSFFPVKADATILVYLKFLGSCRKKSYVLQVGLVSGAW